MEYSYNLYDGEVILVVPYNNYLGLILSTNMSSLCLQWLMVRY